MLFPPSDPPSEKKLLRRWPAESFRSLPDGWNGTSGEWNIEFGQLTGRLEPTGNSSVNFSAAFIKHDESLPEEVEIHFEFTSEKATGIEAGIYDKGGSCNSSRIVECGEPVLVDERSPHLDPYGRGEITANMESTKHSKCR